ncbi:treacle protein isoform X4 [Phyllobates terribilis]|uniref:treacle protein isoform X4 n=1 Tax=Phyllobates terribilis TaxID=111132 RepID=UPI003CCA9E10
MAKRSTALLALIYNHLLEHGLSETARKLQLESGENFNSQKKTLEKMYKHWNKKSKKKSGKKNEAQTKKTDQQDPVVTQSAEDKGDEAKKAVPGAQDKKVSVKRTVKMKVVEPKEMDPAKKSAPKAAPRSRKRAAPSTEIPAASAQGGDDPDGEEEMASSAPGTEPPLKPTPAATAKSKTTNARAAKQLKRGSAKTTPEAAAGETLVAANGEAVVISDVSNNSESSDETDIEKQVRAAAPKAAKTTAAPAKAKRGSSKTTGVTPTTKVSTAARKTTSAKTKENSDSKKVPAPAVSKVKAAAQKVAKTTEKKGRSKTTAATSAPKGRTAVRKSPAKKVTPENSEEPDLDIEFVSPTPESTAPSNMVTSYQKVPVRPIALQTMEEEDGSESSETESEEEPVTQEKIASPKKRTIPASPAKITSAQTAKPAAATQDSKTSAESDSEPEMKAPQVPTPAVAATKQKPRAKPTAVTPASQISAAAVRSPAKMAADESSEESDSDDALSSAVKAPGLSIGRPSPKPSAPIPARVPDSDAESESSDSSDSDLQPGQKVIASQNKTPASAGKTIVTGKMMAQSQPSQDSSETSESEEEEPQAAVPTPQQRTPALGAKGTREVFTAAQPDEESSSEESEDDSDEPISQKVQTPAVAARKPKYISKPTAVTPSSQGSAAAGRTPAKMAAEETSEESDSDDEPSSAVKTPSLTRGAPSPKPPAPIPPRVADSDADSESSDSSDSEETAGLNDQASQTKITAKLSSSVVKTEVDEKMPSQDGSETSESEEEKPQLAVTSPPQRKPALAATPPQRKPALAATPPQRKPALAATPPQRKPALAATPPQRKPILAAKGKQEFPAVVNPGSSSEESEDSDEPGKSVPTPAVAVRKQTSITKPTAGTPASQSSIAAVRTPAKMAADESSEESDSDDEVEAPAQIPAKATVKGKSALAQMPTPSKLGAVKSAGKTPVAMTQATAKVSIKSPVSYTEEAAKKKTTVTTLAKHKSSTSIHILTSTPVLASPAKGKAGLKTAPVLAKDTSESESDEEEESQQIAALAPTTTKASVKKGKGSDMASPSKVRAVKSAGPIAKGASDSSESESSKERAAKGKMASLASSQKTAKKTVGKVSEDVPGTAGDSADDAGELDNSQSLLQAKSKKRKLSLHKKDKTTPANESIEKPSGKKSNVQTQPEAKPTPPAPVTPAGLLDSEEETVLALLEGRSPKKAKVKKHSAMKSRDVAAATVTVQDSSVLEKSLPQHVTSFHSEDEDFIIKSPAVPEHGQLSAKKSSKKRKSASEDSLFEEKDKKAKKAKREENLMADVAEEATSPKSSKKEKSEKKKDGDKTKKESKKLMESLMASFGESTDSGVGLQSKPRKKKVTNND